jgi:hypothetical protein
MMDGAEQFLKSLAGQNDERETEVKVMRAEFRTALTKLLNAHSMDSFCNVPDYLLANLLIAVMEGLARANG